MKILLTGHTGFIGNELCKMAKTKGIKLLGLSTSKSKKTQSIIHDLKTPIREDDCIAGVDGIIHLAAISNIAYCEKNPKESELVNKTASITLCNIAKKRNIPFVFSSTDQVFDGVKGNYTENDIANPINVYGKHKRAVECYLLKEYKKATIVRLPLVLGHSGGYEKAFVEKLRKNKVQYLFKDEIRSPNTVEKVCKILLTALFSKKSIIHAGGNLALSRIEIGAFLCEKYHLPKSLLKGVYQKTIPLPYKRPKNCSLR